MISTDEKGISVRRLKTFLTNLKSIFAEKSHKHNTSDISQLDEALSKKINYVSLTQAEYNLLENKDPNTAYFITDGEVQTNGVNFIVLTQEQYDALSVHKQNVIYFINDAK